MSLTIDPIQASLANLLVVAFAKSTSAGYRLAVALAKTAGQYEESNSDGGLQHWVLFKRTPEDASRALALLRYVGGFKSLLIFAGGRPVPKHWAATEVLECYAVSTACTDYTAHCHLVLDDPLAESTPRQHVSFSLSIAPDAGTPVDAPAPIRYLFPCRLLGRSFHFQVGHPSLPVDQIQAGAVAAGCSWCPHFDPKVFRRLPEQVRIGDQYLGVGKA